MCNGVVLLLLCFVLQDIRLESTDDSIDLGDLYEGVTSLYEINLVSEKDVDWSKLSTVASCACVQVRKDPKASIAKSTVVVIAASPTSPKPVDQEIKWKIDDIAYGKIKIKATVKPAVEMDYDAVRSSDIARGFGKFTLKAGEGVTLQSFPGDVQKGVQIAPTLLDGGSSMQFKLVSKSEPDDTEIYVAVPFTVMRFGKEVKGRAVRTIKILNPGPPRISPSILTLASGSRKGRFIWKDTRINRKDTAKFLIVSADGVEQELAFESNNPKETISVVSFVVPDTWFGTLTIRAVDSASTVLAESKLVCEE
jgi:hypothetical protein